MKERRKGFFFSEKENTIIVSIITLHTKKDSLPVMTQTILKQTLCIE